MEHHTTTSRAEAERLLSVAEKLLRNKELSGCRDFAILAQETEPLLEGSDQILAVAEVLLAADTKRLTNNQHDWYAILQIPQRTDESELIKKQYRRLALLLHPDKNKYAFADSAFRLVAEAWAVLSDPAKKSLYDRESVARFTKVDLASVSAKKQGSQKRPAQRNASNFNQKLPVRRSGRSASASAKMGNKTTPTHHYSNRNTRPVGNFWTACPYCYNLYEYPRAYEGCCLRCDNEKCKKAFTAAEILSMPPMVPGMAAYYCCWGFFPMGFRLEGGNGFPKWMPPMFGAEEVAPTETAEADPVSAPPPPVTVSTAVPMVSPEKRKRGRPRKNV